MGGDEPPGPHAPCVRRGGFKIPQVGCGAEPRARRKNESCIASAGPVLSSLVGPQTPMSTTWLATNYLKDSARGAPEDATGFQLRTMGLGAGATPHDSHRRDRAERSVRDQAVRWVGAARRC